MPNDLKINDIIKKVEELPPQLRKETRGIIPSFWGDNVRVTKSFEKDIMRILNPQEAEDVGLALGMQVASEWVVRGIPSYATKAQIIKTLAQSSNGWPGWTVRPKKTLTSSSARRGQSTWILEAANDPPLRAITLNNAVITIEMFMEKSNPTIKKLLAPSKPKADNVDLVNLYSESTEEDQSDADKGELRPMDVETIVSSVSIDQVMQQKVPEPEHQPPQKRKCDEQRAEPTTGGPTSATLELMMAHLQKDSERAAAESAKKDELITALQATISNLQEELKALRQAVVEMSAK